MNALQRNIFIEIEYDGTNYCGWQIQSKNSFKKSIQQVLEHALQKILQEKIKVIASGRTDAGVHAKAQVANFKTTSSISCQKLQKALNAVLPEDISISCVKETNFDFHARYQAKSKIYRYHILNRPYRSVFLRRYVYFFPYSLDLALMQKEARVLLGRHDFSSFQAKDKKRRDAYRTIKKIKVSKKQDLITIEIEADGFLYNMARNIVGTLLEIGRGRFAKGSMKRILKSRNRDMAGPTVPACGLFLWKVKY